jgi:hypothetical protein
VLTATLRDCLAVRQYDVKDKNVNKQTKIFSIHQATATLVTAFPALMAPASQSEWQLLSAYLCRWTRFSLWLTNGKS